MHRRRSVLRSRFFVVAAAIEAQEWGQWRGPGRDGVAASLPASWPSSVKPVWRVDVGEGYSSPVVAGGRIVVHSRRDPEEIVTAIDLQSGKVLWQQKYQSPYAKNQYAVRMAKGPNSTPLVAGARVFTLGATGVLSAWRLADGTRAWRKDYSPHADTSKLFCGTAMSPMLEDGSLIVHVGSDVHGSWRSIRRPATSSGPGRGPARDTRRRSR